MATVLLRWIHGWTNVRKSLATLICCVAVAGVGDRVAHGRGVDDAEDSAALARGKYVVEGVAMCGRCHTPRDADGQPDDRRPLAGGPVPILPARPTEGWADVTPRLAGLPPGTDDEIVRLLMTGISRTGKPPRPPMPQFRMTRGDAEAVLVYLKSLPSAY